MFAALDGKFAEFAIKIRRFGTAHFVLAIAVLFVCIQIARLFWLLVTPLSPLGDWRPSQVQIVPFAERPALFGGFDPFFRTPIVADGTEVVTSLPLKLFGIRTNEASGGGSAIIANAEGIQNSWSIGEEIMPGATLHSVAFDHVVISNNGILEKLFIDQSVPAENVTPEPEASTSISDTQGSGARLNANSLQQSIGFLPRNENGKITGLVVSAKDDGAMLAITGLQKGDIITTVNGRPVAAASDLVAQVRPGARLSLEVERGAQKVPVAIILEQ